MEASPEQLAEYEKQLADVVELLKASPEDESLVSLKSDIEELVALTRESLDSQPVGEEVAKATADTGTFASEAPPEVGDVPLHIQVNATPKSQSSTAVATQPTKKKSKKSEKKDFEIPANLAIHGADSEKEVNRKKRAIKQLKRKHNAAVKEEESNQKQKSWLNFKKKKIKKEGSIFSTDSDRKKTAFDERTRHK